MISVLIPVKNGGADLVRCLDRISAQQAADEVEIVAFDVTAPVPGVGTPSVERLAHAIASVRPSLLAYQFVVAATPR
ncbi:MAG: hypothetical protein ACJ747_14445 [Gaiellaceae bacterium]